MELAIGGFKNTFVLLASVTDTHNYVLFIRSILVINLPGNKKIQSGAFSAFASKNYYDESEKNQQKVCYNI